MGITAGIKVKKSTVKSPPLGDILVPTTTVDVEAGKRTPKGKEKAGQKNPCGGQYPKGRLILGRV